MHTYKTPKRNANWTKDEVLLLLQLVNEKKGIIKGKFGPHLTIVHKRRAWTEITESLNAAFPMVRRTKEQVEKSGKIFSARGRLIYL